MPKGGKGIGSTGKQARDPPVEQFFWECPHCGELIKVTMKIAQADLTNRLEGKFCTSYQALIEDHREMRKEGKGSADKGAASTPAGVA